MFWFYRLKLMLKVMGYSDLYLLARRGFDGLTENQIQILYGSDGYDRIKKQFEMVEDLTVEQMIRRFK